MSIEAFFLNRSQMQRVAGLVGESDSRRENPALTSTTESGMQQGEDHQAPEVYLAIPRDSEGLPGLNHSTQNVAGADDEPGFGECDIYQIVSQRLLWVERTKDVYNLSEARLRNDAFPVLRTKFGEWVAVNKSVEVEGILTRRLEPAGGPLTGAVFGYARLIEWDRPSSVGTGTGTGTGDDEEEQPDIWKMTNRELRFVNRSVNFRGSPGTFGSFKKLGGEFRVSMLDCDASEEGINVIVELYSDTYGGFTYGG